MIDEADERFVGIVISRFGSHTASGMLDGADDFLQINGYQMIVRVAQPDAESQEQAIGQVMSMGCRAVVLDGANSVSDSVLATLLSNFTQLIVVNRSIESYEDRCVFEDDLGVRFPSYAGGETAASLALDLIDPTQPSSLRPRREDEQESLKNSLTAREKQCLYWIANGKTSSEIAMLLAIAESTVNFHLKNTFVKLNASNRSHVVAKAVALGIVEPI